MPRGRPAPLTPCPLLQREVQRHPAQRDRVPQVLPGAGGEAGRRVPGAGSAALEDGRGHSLEGCHKDPHLREPQPCWLGSGKGFGFCEARNVSLGRGLGPWRVPAPQTRAGTSCICRLLLPEPPPPRVWPPKMSPDTHVSAGADGVWRGGWPVVARVFPASPLPVCNGGGCEAGACRAARRGRAPRQSCRAGGQMLREGAGRWGAGCGVPGAPVPGLSPAAYVRPGGEARLLSPVSSRWLRTHLALASLRPC